MMRFKGFTLIEILVALIIFAIIASITSATLYQAFNTRDKVNLVADKLNQIELTMALIEQDTSQAIARSVRGNDLRLIPVFIGENQYVEFSRSGVLNPNQSHRSSSLQRIAYRCQDGKLYRKSWHEIDSFDRNRFQQKVMLSEVESCRFEYINRTLNILKEWRPQRSIRERLMRPELLPQAIRIKLTLKKWGKLQPVFIVPEAAYEIMAKK